MATETRPSPTDRVSTYHAGLDAVSHFHGEAMLEAVRLAKLARDAVDGIPAESVSTQPLATRLAYAQAAAAAARAMAACVDLEERRCLTYGPEE